MVYLINFTLSPDISRPPEYTSVCTVNFLNRTTSVSCSNTILNVSEYQVILLKQTAVNNLIAVTSRPGILVILPVPSGSYCVLELPTNTDSDVRYANELDILDPVVITTTDCNSGTFIMTTDDSIITPSFAVAIIVGKSSITLPYLTLEHFTWYYT